MGLIINNSYFDKPLGLAINKETVRGMAMKGDTVYSASIANKLPYLTSNNVPYTVTSNKEVVQSTYPLWYVFATRASGYYYWPHDQTEFGKVAFPVHVTIDFGVQAPITKYSFNTSKSGMYIPSKWKLQGSNNGTTFIDIHTVELSAVPPNDTLLLYNASANYRYYRWNMLAGFADQLFMSCHPTDQILRFYS